MEDASDNGTGPGSFFSFLNTPSSVARKAPPADDFVSAHIRSRDVSAQQPAQPVQSSLPGKSEGCGSAAKAQKKSAASLAAAQDQIHPLIRARRLESPEDIAAWIAERKSKYPTEANIRRKALEQQQQQQQQGAKSAVPAKRKRSRKVDEPANPLASMLSAYAAGSDEDGSDDSDSDNKSDISGSSSTSSESSAPETAPSKHYVRQTPLRPSKMAPEGDRRSLRVCRFFARGNCNKGDACPFAHPESIKARQSDDARNEGPLSGQGRKAASLLEMLLAKDIERENYRLLQCIDYIHRHNFLGVPVDHTTMY